MLNDINVIESILMPMAYIQSILTNVADVQQSIVLFIKVLVI